MSSSEQDDDKVQFVALFRNGHRVLFEVEASESEAVLELWKETRRKDMKEGKAHSCRIGERDFIPSDVSLFMPFEAGFFPELDSELDDGGGDDEDDDEDGNYQPVNGPSGGNRIRKIGDATITTKKSPVFVGPDPGL